MTMPSIAPPVGAEVFSSDGGKLGTVKALRGMFFKVDAPMHPDYWLSSTAILGSPTVDRVTMTFDKDHIDGNKQTVSEA